ncbi:MAG: hypothetical protein WCG06_06040, partial [Candidatus Omnitrophota bacterium]
MNAAEASLTAATSAVGAGVSDAAAARLSVAQQRLSQLKDQLATARENFDRAKARTLATAEQKLQSALTQVALAETEEQLSRVDSSKLNLNRQQKARLDGAIAQRRQQIQKRAQDYDRALTQAENDLKNPDANLQQIKINLNKPEAQAKTVTERDRRVVVEAKIFAEQTRRTVCETALNQADQAVSSHDVAQAQTILDGPHAQAITTAEKTRRRAIEARLAAEQARQAAEQQAQQSQQVSDAQRQQNRRVAIDRIGQIHREGGLTGILVTNAESALQDLRNNTDMSVQAEASELQTAQTAVAEIQARFAQQQQVQQPPAHAPPAQPVAQAIQGPANDIRVRLSQWRFEYQSGNHVEADSILYEIIEEYRDADGELRIEDMLALLGDMSEEKRQEFEEWIRLQAEHFALAARSESGLKQLEADILSGLGRKDNKSGKVRYVRTAAEARALRLQLTQQGLVEGKNGDFVIYTEKVMRQELRRACQLADMDVDPSESLTEILARRGRPGFETGLGKRDGAAFITGLMEKIENLVFGGQSGYEILKQSLTAAGFQVPASCKTLYDLAVVFLANPQSVADADQRAHLSGLCRIL